MVSAARSIIIALLLTGCVTVPTTDASPSDAAVDADSRPADALPSDTGVDAGGLVLVRGGVGTMSARPPPVGGEQVVDEGFEFQDTTCAGTLCVSGGIVP